MKKLVLLSLLSITLLTGCPGNSNPTPSPSASASPGTKTLFDRLGGKDAITKVVADLVTNVVADEKIKARFTSLSPDKVENLKTKLVEQVCEATGGPCKYSGKNMVDAHTGMKVTKEEFDALVADLKKSLDDNKVGKTEQDELLGALGGMEKDIVGK